MQLLNIIGKLRNKNLLDAIFKIKNKYLALF